MDGPCTADYFVLYVRQMWKAREHRSLSAHQEISYSCGNVNVVLHTFLVGVPFWATAFVCHSFYSMDTFAVPNSEENQFQEAQAYESVTTESMDSSTLATNVADYIVRMVHTRIAMLHESINSRSPYFPLACAMRASPHTKAQLGTHTNTHFAFAVGDVGIVVGHLAIDTE